MLMIYRFCGAFLLTAGFGSIGFLLKKRRKQELLMLQQIYRLIDSLICDLQYRQSPLYRLVNDGIGLLSGELRCLIVKFSAELESQVSPDVGCCMAAALASFDRIPNSVRKVLTALGQSFGRFDMEGQLRWLEAIQSACRKDCRYLEDRLESYCRCCQAYSLGAGAIIALILL